MEPPCSIPKETDTPLYTSKTLRDKTQYQQTQGTSQKCQTWHTWAKACVRAAVAGQNWGNWPIWAIGCLARLQVAPDQVVLDVFAVWGGGVARQEVDGWPVDPGVHHQRLRQAAAQEGHQGYPNHAFCTFFSVLCLTDSSLSHIDPPPPSTCYWSSISPASCSPSSLAPGGESLGR